MNHILADIESTQAYLEAFAIAHPEAPSFIFGTLEDVITASRGNDDFHYPLLWLDLPQMTTDDNDMANITERYEFNITALYKADLDDKNQRVLAYKKAVDILQNLQKKLRADNRNGIIVCSLSGMRKLPLNPTLFNGSHYGYILYFEATFHANQLY